MIATGLSQSQVQNLIQQKLKAVRDALNEVAELYGWTSSLASADLATASGWSSTDAGSVLAAVADANALNQVYMTGQAPGTYPQVTGTPYVYASSIRAVIGPQ